MRKFFSLFRKIKYRYLFLGLLLYAAFLLTTLPAQVAYGYWKQYLAPSSSIILTDVSGSLWSGRAGKSIIGKQRFNSVQWRFVPSALLLGKLEVAWELAVTDGYAKGVAGASVLGQYFLTNVEGLIPMSYLAKTVNISALQPGGALGLNLDFLDVDSLDVKDMRITGVTGNIAWHSAEMTLLRPMRLGDLKVTLETGNEGIKGILSDGGGPLQAEGVLTLDEEGGYQFNAALGVRDPSQTDLKNALRSLGRPDSDGKYKIKRSGKLSQLRF